METAPEVLLGEILEDGSLDLQLPFAAGWANRGTAGLKWVTLLPVESDDAGSGSDDSQR